MSLWIVLMVASWLACAGLGAWVATQKDRSPLEGALLGFLFAFVGVIVEALLPQGVAALSEPDDDEPSPAFLADIPSAPVKRGWGIPIQPEKPPEQPPPSDLIQW